MQSARKEYVQFIRLMVVNLKRRLHDHNEYGR